MKGNPEFRRNLWIQFGGTRVLIASMLSGMLLICALALDIALTRQRAFVPDILAFVAYWLTVAILIFWAGHQAAGAVLREIRGRTWDAQRLSTLHPWSMAWGKLFGSTSLAWLVALICAAAYAAADGFMRPPHLVATAVAAVLGYGLFCQATGLLASLARLSGRPGERAGGTTLAHVIGLLATAILGSFVIWALEKEGRWFGYVVGSQALRLVTIWLFALWAVIGVYRRMRRELQMRSAPWAWLLFLATLVVYAEGLAYDRGLPQAALLVPTSVVLLMLWAMTLIEAKDPLTLRQCFGALRAGNWSEAATLVPLWLVTYVAFAAIVAVSLVIAAGGAIGTLRIPGELDVDLVLVLAAAFLFATRDVLIVQTLTLGRDGGMAGLYGAIFWFVLYFAIPAVFVAGKQSALLGAFLPTGQGGWMLCLLPAAAEALVCAVLLRWRWAAFWRENRAKATTA